MFDDAETRKVQERRMLNIGMLGYLLEYIDTTESVGKRRVIQERPKLMATLERGIEALLQIIASAGKYVTTGPKLKNSEGKTYIDDELAAFREVCGIEEGSWKITDEEHLNWQVATEISCLSSRVMRAVNLFTIEDFYQGGSRMLFDYDKPWFLIMKLGYLNRKACALAEKIKEKQKFKTDSLELANQSKSDNNLLLQLFISCQRVRTSTFDTPFTDKISFSGTEIKFEDIAKFFKDSQEDIKRPFNNKIHRMRPDRAEHEPHPDQFLLAINSGAHGKKVGEFSSLGLFARRYGLPSGCDISGTTTDAVGAAILIDYLFKNTDCLTTSEAGEFDPAYYILACAASLCIAGHHTLDEVASAASLWSKANYKPFSAGSFSEILNSLHDPFGEEQYGEKLSDIKDTWINKKWKTLIPKFRELSGTKDPCNIEFNDEEWEKIREAIEKIRGFLHLK